MVPVERPLTAHAEGLVFDIQAHSVHDGPGCRTTVFLSGCPLRCSWCANPEGLLPRPRLMVRTSRCRADGYPCVDACPHGAVRTDPAEAQPPRFDRALCGTCEERSCIPACPNGALELSGRRMSVTELLRILERDRDYWGSDGGVTFSGGEPLLQSAFLLAALDACAAAYIHTVIETSAHADPELVSAVASKTDWLFVDLKHASSEAHRIGTGVGNERILANLRRLADRHTETRLVVRIPIIPGFNDSPEDLRAAGRLLGELGLVEVNLLPFHRMAASKYEQLGLRYAHAETEPPTPAEMVKHQEILTDMGLRCYVGSETPF
jgi:pyruvate formate lyase activating enzyme